MKGSLVFETKQAVSLKFGGIIIVYMDCYQIGDLGLEFSKSFTFSWIALDPSEPNRKVLMDQHRGRPCHLHIGDAEVTFDVQPDSIETAMSLFWNEVTKYFGELQEAP